MGDSYNYKRGYSVSELETLLVQVKAEREKYLSSASDSGSSYSRIALAEVEKKFNGIMDTLEFLFRFGCFIKSTARRLLQPPKKIKSMTNNIFINGICRPWNIHTGTFLALSLRNFVEVKGSDTLSGWREKFSQFIPQRQSMKIDTNGIAHIAVHGTLLNKDP